MHKVCCPCCFGRSCLVPNQGYLSEAAASIVDTVLKLNVVPKTKIVKLASKTFYYSKYDRVKTQAIKSASERFPDAVREHTHEHTHIHTCIRTYTSTHTCTHKHMHSYLSSSRVSRSSSSLE